MKLVFLGAPGAGKGTQAKVLAEKYGICHISTGDMLRDAVRRNSPVGTEAKAFMDRGELVPDAVVIKIILERLSAPDISKGFILDGFPRTQKQAESLDEELKKIGLNIDLVVYFETTEAVSVARLSGRRVCRKCQKNYHIKTMRPAKDGICDVCGGELYQREDDREETVLKRLKVYHGQTESLIEYYKSRGLLEKVDGDMDVSGVFTALTGYFAKRRLVNR